MLLSEKLTTKHECAECKTTYRLTEFAAVVPRNPTDITCNALTELVYFCHTCWHEKGIAKRYQI